MIEEALKSIGLSEKEIIIYIALLKLGPQPVSVIGKESGINRTTAYVILKKLMKKGILSMYLRADVRFFRAVPPDNLEIFVDRKMKEFKLAKKQLDKALPEFQKLLSASSQDAKVQLFEGLDGVKALYDETLKEKVPISEYLFDYNCDLPKMWDFWDVYIERREKSNIPIRLIAADNEVGLDLKRRDKKEYRKTRLVPKESFPHGNNLIMIFGDNYSYFSYADGKFVGALIKDKYLATMEQSIFNFLWDSTKEYDKKVWKKFKSKTKPIDFKKQCSKKENSFDKT